jgi:hypothetical protein
VYGRQDVKRLLVLLVVCVGTTPADALTVPRAERSTYRAGIKWAPDGTFKVGDCERFSHRRVDCELTERVFDEDSATRVVLYDWAEVRERRDHVTVTSWLFGDSFTEGQLSSPMAGMKVSAAWR